ncbi:MAG: hypothetical protein OHK0029_02880 [Armatimonadaceae bacterium]
MNLAKKLREVVTANFIEIVRSEDDEQKKSDAPPASERSSAVAADPPPAAPEEMSVRAPESEIPPAVDTEADPESAVEVEAVEAAEAEEITASDAVNTDEAKQLAAASAELEAFLQSAEAKMAEQDGAVEPASAVPGDEAVYAEATQSEIPLPLSASLTVAPDPVEMPVAEDMASRNMEADPVEAILQALDRDIEDASVTDSLPADPQADVTSDPAESIPQATVAAEAPTTDTAITNPLEFLDSKGMVDLATVLRQANLPPVNFTADQAAKLLVALPADLPMRVKRLTVQAALDAVTTENPVDPQNIVADAMLKRFHISQFQEALDERLTGMQRVQQGEIEQLEAELARVTADLQGRIQALQKEVDKEEARRQTALEICQKRVSQMEQVILFFQTDEAVLQAAQPAATVTEEDELPPFMRDDVVRRMLNIEGEATPAVESDSDTRRNGKSKS